MYMVTGRIIYVIVYYSLLNCRDSRVSNAILKEAYYTEGDHIHNGGLVLY